MASKKKIEDIIIEDTLKSEKEKVKPEKGDKSKIKEKDFERKDIKLSKNVSRKMDDTVDVDVREKLCDNWDKPNKIEMSRELMETYIFGPNGYNQHFNIDEFVLLMEQTEWDLNYCEICESSPCKCEEV